MSRRRTGSLGVLGAALVVVLGGCQTWVPTAALTLPTPDYLSHFPQYIPPSPQFPLPNELASQQRAAAQAYGPAVVGPAPAPVPGGQFAPAPPPPGAFGP